MSQPVEIGSARGLRTRPLTLEVVKVLRCMGGAAHEVDIIETLVLSRRRQGRETPHDLPQAIKEVLISLEDTSAPAACDPALFYRPFGPNSLRWALRHDVVSSRLPQPMFEQLEATLSGAMGRYAPTEHAEAVRERVLAVLNSEHRLGPFDLMLLDELRQAGTSRSSGL